jgi:hypothetical protein
MPDRSDLAARLSAQGVARACAWLLPVLLALRLPSALDGADSVNFALGLLDFDPALEQPHFPGYPVYIALCRLLVRARLPEALALALPGVLASAALVPAQIALGRRLGLSEKALVCAALLLVSQPLLWFEGPRPMPDLLATVCAWVALALGAGERPGAGGIALGVALGIRIDLAPLAFAAVALPRAARVPFGAGFAFGIGLWLPAFVFALPPGAPARGLAFALGHFSVWGSSALAGAGGSSAARGVALGLAGPAMLVLAVFGVRRAPEALRRFLAFSLGPYLLWVLLGQNLSSARHFLPLAPALGLLAACALAAIPRGAPWALTCAALAASAVALAVVRPPHPDGRELYARASAACPDCSAIFAGPSQRLLEHYAPAGAPLYRRASLADVRRDLDAWPMLDGAIGITSELAGPTSLVTPGSEIGGGLRLYRVDAAALR